MRNFDYEKISHQIIDDESISLLTRIYEFKGIHNYILKYSDIDFSNMKKIAKINSLIAAHKFENISITLQDIEYMLNNNSRADNSNAHIQFQGYHEALNYIFDDKTTHINVELVLEILKKSNANRRLCSDEYRRGDKGDLVSVYKPGEYLPSFKYQSADGDTVSNYIDNAISAFKDSFAVKNVDPLISATILISDYLAIHPFYGHNKKVCWLLFNYLLKFCDFKIAEYISVEKIISENMETFYKVWEHTMKDWNDSKNDYKEMTKFLLKVLLQTYKAFFDFMELYHSKMTKPERIEYILKDNGYTMSKRELIELCPDISDTTIEITLGDLVRRGKIEKVGSRRYTRYRYNHK